MESQSLANQIRELSKKYGKILTLNEIIACKKRGEITLNKELSVDNYAFVHATNFPPKNNIIETVYAKLKRGEIIDFDNHASGGDTTHFAANGQVEEHGNGADWDKCKYAAVVLGRVFLDRYKDITGSYLVQDLIVDGSPDITDQFVLCEKMEDAERIQEMNPGIIAIPDDDNLGARSGPKRVEAFLGEVLEIEPRIPSAYGWLITVEKMLTLNEIDLSRNGLKSPKGIDREAEAKYYADIENYLGRVVNKYEHEFTIESLEGSFIYCSNRYQGNADKQIQTIFLSDKNSYPEYLKNPEQHQINIEHLAWFTKKFNRELAEVGLTDWIYFAENNDEIQKRVDESRAVDEFLGVKAEQVYDGDMISTNIKRIEMIGDRNPALKEALFRHIVEDYKTMEAHYMDRVDTKDMDFKTYSESVKSRLSELGLEKAFEEQFMSIEEKAAEQKKQQEKIEDEREEALLNSYGYKIHDTSDPVLRDISKLRAITFLELQMMIQDIRDGNVDADGWPNFLGKDWNVTSKMEKSVLNKMTQHLKDEKNPERLDEPLSFLGLRGEDLFRKDENGNIVPTFSIYQDKAEELFESQARTAIEIVEKERSGQTSETSLEDLLTGLYQTSRLVPEELEAEQANIKRNLSAEKGIEVENDNNEIQ